MKANGEKVLLFGVLTFDDLSPRSRPNVLNFRYLRPFNHLESS